MKLETENWKASFSIGFKYVLTCIPNVLHLSPKILGEVVSTKKKCVEQNDFKTCLSFIVNWVLDRNPFHTK